MKNKITFEDQERQQAEEDFNSLFNLEDGFKIGVVNWKMDELFRGEKLLDKLCEEMSAEQSLAFQLKKFPTNGYSFSIEDQEEIEKIRRKLRRYGKSLKSFTDEDIDNLTEGQNEMLQRMLEIFFEFDLRPFLEKLYRKKGKMFFDIKKEEKW